MSRFRKEQREIAGPSRDDELQAAVLDKCAAAITDYVVHSLNVGRPIRSLTKHERRGIASAAISTWIGERLKQYPEQAAQTNPEAVLNLIRAG